MLQLMALVFAATLATSVESSDRSEFSIGPIKIVNAWSRETAQKATTGAGFLTIQNLGKTPDRLIKIKSENSGLVEIHTMTMDGGVMRMRPLTSGLTIAPGSEVVLQPGAEHIMFMDLKSPIQTGKDLSATLVFERAGEVKVTFHIKAIGTTPAPNHHNH